MNFKRKLWWAQHKEQIFKIYAITLTLVLGILGIIYFSYSKFSSSNEMTMYETTVEPFIKNDYFIASYIDGEWFDSIPGKNDGYEVDKIVCDNDAVGTWNSETWSINISNATKKIKCSIYFKLITVFDFDYIGTEQVFTVPLSGTYKLETWGAQGGSHSVEKHGGYGGYSVGNMVLAKDNSLYLNIGGIGMVNDKRPWEFTKGGYNGGGDTYTNEDKYISYGSSGGGATHIATKSGILSTLESYKTDIIIVSGGGSNYDIFQNVTTGIGGTGGGNVGGSGSAIYYKGNVLKQVHATGGSQTSFGLGASSSVTHSNGKNGNFGLGGNSSYNAGAGGGGYYGGGGGATSEKDSSGAGGSGYIGNTLLTNKAMYCYNCEESSEESTKTISTTCAEETPTSNCAKKGNGYARITYIGNDK